MQASKIGCFLLTVLGGLSLACPIFSTQLPSLDCKNPALLAKFGCVPEYAVVEEHFKKGDWLEVIHIVDGLQEKGVIDRALTIARGKAYSRRAAYGKALVDFTNAQEQRYLCMVSTPTIPIASEEMKYRAYEAILWFNIHECYLGLGDANQSAMALVRTMDLMTEALAELKPLDVKIIGSKLLRAYSTYEIAPW